MDQKSRFDALQASAVRLINSADSLRQESHVPTAAGPTVRAACFKALLLTGLMSSNAITALYTLRKQDGKQAPAIDQERDYVTFQERVAGIAGAEGLACSAVADGIMHTAQLLLNCAEEAELQVERLLSTGGV